MSTEIWTTVGLMLAGYLLGAVPFGILASKMLGTVDPRSAGSRNIGFTNVLRVSGKTAGLVTLVGDFGKGWGIAWLASWQLQTTGLVLVVATSVILGHLYPVYLKFHGGKGVATGLGAILGVAPIVGFAMIGIWFLTVTIWRYSSGGAILAFSALPVLALVTGQGWEFVVFALAVAGLILMRHKDNLRRLRQGKEEKIGSVS
ncbi:MAG: glycerol-3-phosphate 1-O-acyltransferase PlsY [Nitrospirales bacterium]